MISEAEQLLLDQIRSGDSQAWSNLVDRYAGRLLAFARMRAPRGVDPEDLVQEVFVCLLKGIGRFRRDCSLETYLFSILRRRLIDVYRQRASVALVCGAMDDQVLAEYAGNEPPASWYLADAEQQDMVRKGLSDAILEMVEGFRAGPDLVGLRMAELLFYCQLPNHQVARLMDTTPNQVGVFKHRCIAQVRQHQAGLADGLSGQAISGLEGTLTELWQSLRPSCPKRNTIGGYILGTLDQQWYQYVDWHINRIGCCYCRASLEDLQAQTSKGQADALKRRIMESTVGLLGRT